MSRLDLKAVLHLTDMISRPLKTISNQAKLLQREFETSSKALRQLQKTMDNANHLNEMRNKLRLVQNELKSTANEEKRLSAAISASQNPTKAQLRNLEQVRKKMTQLNQTQSEYRQKMSQLGTALKSAGFNTKNFADSQKDIANKMNLANAAMNRQKQELKELREHQKKLNQAQQQYQNSKQHASNMRMNGMMMMGAGAATLYSLKKPIEESKHWDTEVQRVSALGMGKETSEKAIKYAQEMKTFGTSTLENLTLLRDGLTIFADLHHAEMVNPTLAKMKFANKAMFGQERGEDNERVFMDMLKVIELRGGLQSEKTFLDQANKIQQVITATGGRVQGGEWLNAIKTGGIAVKGMSDEALYYKMESIVQEWGGFRFGTAAMSAYQNIYQGRTTKRAANNMERLGLISDPSKLKHDKSGQISFLDVGAIKGADIFKKDQFAWMEQILLPELAKRGITKKDDVLDAIGSIFTNRTASNLFGDMFLQRDIINKSAKMNAGADNIDQLYGKAKNIGAGHELETKAKLHDAYLKFGTTIMPIYIKALQVATSTLKGMTEWMQQHPRLTKAIGVGLISLGAGLLVFGSLALLVGSILVPFFTLRYALKMIRLTVIGSIGGWISYVAQVAKLLFFSTQLKGLSLAMLFRKTGQAILFLSRTLLKAPFKLTVLMFRMMGQAILFVGKSIAFVSRALLMNPLGLFIMAIAVAALAIYRYWQPIKALFKGFWDGLKIGLAPVMDDIRTAFTNFKTMLAPMQPIWDWLVAAWQTFKGVLVEILTPMQMTNQELQNATSYGQILGQSLGIFIGVCITVGSHITDYLVTPLRGWIELINLAINKWNSLTGMQLPTGFQIPDLAINKIATTSIKPPTPTKPTAPVVPFKTGATAPPVTNHFAAANINISGVSDPNAVSSLVNQQLRQHQMALTGQMSRSYSDNA